jgi:beta-lactamase superfamily II metal-dependent hydrolase
MASVLGSIGARYYLDNGVRHSTATYLRTLEAVRTSGAQYLRATERTITLGSARLRVLPTPPGQGQNNTSVGILVEYGEFRALLTGDSATYELHYWLKHTAIPRVQVVKVAHHGARNGTSAEWIQATKPRLAVISVGARNSYRHPSPSVVQQWESAGARVLRTDLKGTIVVLAKRDGEFTVAAERPNTSRLSSNPSSVHESGLASPSELRARLCCKMCTVGKACGDTCISRAYTCHQPPGCACDAQP